MTSIQLPFVFTNITEERINDVFKSLKWAVEDDIRLDIVPRVNRQGQAYNQVYVHFNQGWREDISNDPEAALIAGKEIKITYDSPWYWRIRLNRSHKRTAEEVEAYKQAQGEEPTVTAEIIS
jgi:hypothetical protein